MLSAPSSSSSAFDPSVEPIPVGELFSAQLWPGPQVVCRSYHFFTPTLSGIKDQQNAHKLCFRHGNVTGNWVLILDGKVLQIGFEPIVHRSFSIAFDIDGEEAYISAHGTATLGYTHTFAVNGEEVKELRSIHGGEIIDFSLGTRIPMHISIPDTRTFHDGNRQVTMYQIYAQSGSSGKAIVERRFSDFVILDKIVRNLTDGKLHQYLPKLPEKVLNPWIDQCDEAFIASRKDILQVYLCELLKHPLIPTFSDFLCFVGMHPITGDPLRELLSTALIEDCDVLPDGVGSS